MAGNQYDMPASTLHSVDAAFFRDSTRIAESAPRRATRANTFSLVFDNDPSRWLRSSNQLLAHFRNRSMQPEMHLLHAP